MIIPIPGRKGLCDRVPGWYGWRFTWNYQPLPFMWVGRYRR